MRLIGFELFRCPNALYVVCLLDLFDYQPLLSIYSFRVTYCLN